MSLGATPRKDQELLAWSLNFKTLITATPTVFGLTAGQATQYGTAHTAFATALQTATEPTTRTKAAIAAKDSAKITLRALAGSFGGMVDKNIAVTNAQKIELGLNVRATPSPIPAPSAAPKLTVKTVLGRTVTLQLENADVTKRARPAGVQGASVFSHVGDAPPESISSWVFEGSTTKTTVDVAFETSVAPGAKVWFCAFWYSARALSGPACTPISANLQFGGVSMAA